jgi:hypothetical protein
MHGRLPTGSFQQAPRDVKTNDVMTRPCQRDCDPAIPAADIEHALARLEHV